MTDPLWHKLFAPVLLGEVDDFHRTFLALAIKNEDTLGRLYLEDLIHAHERVAQAYERLADNRALREETIQDIGKRRALSPESRFSLLRRSQPEIHGRERYRSVGESADVLQYIARHRNALLHLDRTPKKRHG